ncbi:hypothetical protein BDZ88DRAFT_508304 [Geranomyces variabilis]|nr:hypothetical protein BDZ88DRAFT_508304 [Geranomyces variabilis]KAJ3134429.1 hypothetical protein HDU90_005043 [Geranomyces variabilis]
MASLAPPTQHTPHVPTAAPPASTRPRRQPTKPVAAEPEEDEIEDQPASTRAFEGSRDGSRHGSAQDLLTTSRPRTGDPETLFETHVQAPSPSQTYWQIMVLADGNVVLRDWPRKRFSTKWTRDGDLNPSEKKLPWAEVGEWEERIKVVFGKTVWETVATKCGIPHEE